MVGQRIGNKRWQSTKQFVVIGINWQTTFYRLAIIAGQGLLVMFAGFMENSTGNRPLAWSITFFILAGLFLIIEAMTAGFLVFWLSIGSLFAMITSFFTDNILVQTTVFVISSTIMIFATKPFVKKFVDVKPTNTNAFSIIGKKALVIKEINSHSVGQIKINGEVWSAESENGETIPEGSEVEILNIKGVKAIVKGIKVTADMN